MNVCRPYRDGVSARSMVGVICTVGFERVRDVQITDLAMARNLAVEVVTAPLSLKGAVEPARAAAVRIAVGRGILPGRIERAISWRVYTQLAQIADVFATKSPEIERCNRGLPGKNWHLIKSQSGISSNYEICNPYLSLITPIIYKERMVGGHFLGPGAGRWPAQYRTRGACRGRIDNYVECFHICDPSGRVRDWEVRR